MFVHLKVKGSNPYLMGLPWRIERGHNRLERCERRGSESRGHLLRHPDSCGSELRVKHMENDRNKNHLLRGREAENKNGLRIRKDLLLKSLGQAS